MLKTTKKIKATYQFNKKIAKGFHKMAYYDYEQDRLKYLWENHLEKLKMGTSHQYRVTEVIDSYVEEGKKGKKRIFKVLAGIRNKNIHFIKNKVTNPPKHSQLNNLIANPHLLIQAYRNIRKNKGAMTEAYILPNYLLKTFNKEQMDLIKKSYNLPDEISWETILAMSSLIKKGTYPWGASRRIWIPKPGIKDKMRPITIPPFSDKIVQEAIRMVLEAIYEPTFMHMNVSFGFRASNGCHENITLIKNKGQAMTTAIEGDIEDAYPNLDNNILLKILAEKINDQKFLNLLRKRLKLITFDFEKNKYEQTFLGVPQGGIDSPYLFNIFLLGMDSFIKTHVQKLLDEENQKRSQTTQTSINKDYIHLKNSIQALKKKYNNHIIKYKFSKSLQKYEYILPDIPKNRKNPLYITENTLWFPSRKVAERHQRDKESLKEEIQIIKQTLKDIKKKKAQKIKVAYRNPALNKLRYCYTRYADDFIILGNFSQNLAKKIKEDLKEWLKTNRNAKLSDSKTIITNLKKEPAKFLGFEIKATSNRKLTYVKYKKLNKTVLQRTAGWAINISPDRNRLINRQFMKGYCDRKGFPKSIPWLTAYEPHIIIKRFNDVMSGLAEYYIDFIDSPYYLSRWLYILRYSAIKTLAQKYNTKISKIFEKFRDQNNNITAKYICKAVEDNKNVTLEKSWTLKESKQLYEKKYKNKYISEKIKRIENGEFIFNDNITQRTPRIMDTEFLDRINWVNIRTQAAFDLPCCQCGSLINVEMHHLKHIRKSKYSLIPHPNRLQKMMNLRNRKQVPLCRTCHNKVHEGENNKIIKVSHPIKLFDNRIIDSERFIHPGEIYQSPPFIENLISKGWRKIENVQ